MESDVITNTWVLYDGTKIVAISVFTHFFFFANTCINVNLPRSIKLATMDEE